MLLRQADGDSALVEALQSNGLDGWSWLRAGLIFVSALVLSRVLKYVVRRTLARRVDEALAELIARLLAYVIVIVGLVYALESLGVAVGPVLGALGIAGIALAFALQDILENFVAGILLQLKRPFTYGDQVAINDHDPFGDGHQVRHQQLHTERRSSNERGMSEATSARQLSAPWPAPTSTFRSRSERCGWVTVMTEFWVEASSQPGIVSP